LIQPSLPGSKNQKLSRKAAESQRIAKKIFAFSLRLGVSACAFCFLLFALCSLPFASYYSLMCSK
jgi:hypothetical protein